MNRIVGVSIPGLTKNTEYDLTTSSVNIYKSTIDLTTLKRSVSGFTINDFPFPELFKIYPNLVRKVINADDIYPDDVYINVEMAVEGEDPPFANNEYLWIHKELVRVSDITAGDTYWEYQIERGMRGTAQKRYMGDTNRQKANLDDFTHRNYIERHKRDYRGLRVELWDISNEENEIPILLTVGIIKAYSIRNGVVIIDCEDITSALSISLPQVKTTDSKNAEIDYGFQMTRMLYFGLGAKENRDNGISLANTYDWFYETQSELFQYIEDDGSLERWCFDSIYTGFYFNKRSAKLIELVEMMEFLTLEFIVFENGKFKFAPLLKQVSSFQTIGYDEKNILKDLSGASYITEPLMMPNVISLQFDDRKVNYNMVNRIGLATESSINITVPMLYDERSMRDIFESMVLNYSGFIDFAVCLLKFNMPELKLQYDYNTGDFIKIKDIKRIETLQENGREVMQYGLVVKIDKEEINMIVTDYRIFKPIAPMLEVDYYEPYSTDEDTGYDLYFYGNLPLILADVKDALVLTEDSPYPENDKRAYFLPSESILLYDENYNILGVGGIVNVTTGVNSEGKTYSRIREFDNIGTVIPKYVGWGKYGNNTSNIFRNKFFYINANGSSGGGKWV